MLAQKRKLLLIILTLPILILAILFLSGCNKFEPDNNDLNSLTPNDFESEAPSDNPDSKDEKSSDKTNSKNPETDNRKFEEDDIDNNDESNLPTGDGDLSSDDNNNDNDPDGNSNENESNDDNDNDNIDDEKDDEVHVPETKLEIKLKTYEEKFSYSFENNVIYKTFGENNAVYLSFELIENSNKVSGARFEISATSSVVILDEVNYNSVYLLISKTCEFDLVISTVDGRISKTIHVVVS